jgi:DHA1 family bicyclomycin/chloramphenicol resistance-like MFS transporter
MAIALYLFGMGLINPLGKAGRSGIGLTRIPSDGVCAIGASLASMLPLSPSASLALIVTVGSTLALLVFLPVAMGRTHVEARA